MLSLDTAYRSFGGEVEALSTPTICRLPDSRRHQLSAIARNAIAEALNLDLQSKKEKAQVNAVLGMWKKAGALVVYMDLDDNREERPFIKVRDD
jgi:hypothetical protein